MWHKCSWSRLPLPHHRTTKQTTHKLENNYIKEVLTLYESSRAHNRFANFLLLLLSRFSHVRLCVTPQETEPDLPVSVWESLVVARVDSGLSRGQGTDYNSTGNHSMLA